MCPLNFKLAMYDKPYAWEECNYYPEFLNFLFQVVGVGLPIVKNGCFVTTHWHVNSKFKKLSVICMSHQFPLTVKLTVSYLLHIIALTYTFREWALFHEWNRRQIFLLKQVLIHLLSEHFKSWYLMFKFLSFLWGSLWYF